ncbi:MAG: zinc ribbon domain-containing protein [Eubacteriales bacterium]
MGLLGKIGKMVGSKAFEIVKDELTKKQDRELKKKQDREQSGSYCNYVRNNIVHICKLISEFESETQALINNVLSLKGGKLSFKEKGDFKKLKDKVDKNLKYLYLTRDFFTVLSKNASGLILKDEEIMLVAKFAPFFDGVPVLEINDDEDSDDSLLGELLGEFKETFISSKKSSTHFDFDSYLYRYEEKLEKYIMPDIDSAIESFKNAMSIQEPSVVNTPVIAAHTEESSKKIECPNCAAKLSANSKFCPECGNKIEIKKPSFCTQCGKLIADGAKFCANCGAGIE